MKIFMTGATGFVAKHLQPALLEQGHRVIPLSRRDLAKDPEHLAQAMAGCDAVINLAGAPINRRWTDAYKREIVASRLDTTRRLVQAIALMQQPPASFISTSAIGAYDTHSRYSESDAPNARDFLGDLARDWEAAARVAESLGVRTVITRLALVLGHDGGLLKQLMTPFRLGLGGPIGDGSQHFSWIHADDLVAAYSHLLDHEELSGDFHLSAPHPVTNLEFTRALGDALERPTPFRVPVPVLKLIYGEGAEVMASGQCVVSERLPESGFRFQYPYLEPALHTIAEQVQTECPVTGLLNSVKRI